MNHEPLALRRRADKPIGCFHGGKFFQAIGPRFDALDQAARIINADVLDAWFDPAPQVLAALQTHLPWLCRTSPPTACEGFIEVAAESRGVAASNILPGAGSSDLIFRALPHWLDASSSVLLLDPTYGEYAHVLEKVIGCRIDRLTLSPAHDFDTDLEKLEEALAANDYNLAVLVNPNSPTGRYIKRANLETILSMAPRSTRVWVDETYIEYVGANESLERFAARTENVFVCKSMSKVYALSGLRAAYLCGGAGALEELRAITPPWAMSLPAQAAAVHALQAPNYYQERYRETHALRESLVGTLRGLGWRVVPGSANFLLTFPPVAAPDEARRIVEECQLRGLFLRDASGMGSQLSGGAIRIAVKDAATNLRMAAIIKDVCARLCLC